MKNRIVSGAVILALLVIGLFLLDTLWFNLIICFLSASAVYEIFLAAGYLRHRPLFILSLLYSLCIPFFGTNINGFVIDFAHFIDFTIIYFVLMTIIILASHEKTDFKTAGAIYMLCTLVPLSLSCMVYLRDLPHNKIEGYPLAAFFYIAVIFVGAWITDVFAYFTGRLFGRHKLCPKISPKKTVEGAIGGTFFCVIFFIAGSYIFDAFILCGRGDVNLLIMAIIAVPCAVAGMFGDLFASYIKRSFNIKDFGTLMPGHGGILDRFDSVLLLAPLVLLLAKWIPPLVLTP